MSGLLGTARIPLVQLDESLAARSSRWQVRQLLVRCGSVRRPRAQSGRESSIRVSEVFAVQGSSGCSAGSAFVPAVAFRVLGKPRATLPLARAAVVCPARIRSAPRRAGAVRSGQRMLAAQGLSECSAGSAFVPTVALRALGMATFDAPVVSSARTRPTPMRAGVGRHRPCSPAKHSLKLLPALPPKLHRFGVRQSALPPACGSVPSPQRSTRRPKFLQRSHQKLRRISIPAIALRPREIPPLKSQHPQLASERGSRLG